MRLPFAGIRIRRSSQNGWIVVNSKGEVTVRGAKQTSVRYPLMWSDALARAELKAPPKRILMLGLAGGGALPAIYGAYPDAEVTAVEYDPQMVEIARELHEGAAFPFPTIVIKDAQDALKSSSDAFELILVDIFTGIEPSPLIERSEFWELVAARTAPGGVAILNVAGDFTKGLEANRHFARSKCWQWRSNTFSAFWN